jgi:hypothetical protein
MTFEQGNTSGARKDELGATGIRLTPACGTVPPESQDLLVPATLLTAKSAILRPHGTRGPPTFQPTSVFPPSTVVSCRSKADRVSFSHAARRC